MATPPSIHQQLKSPNSSVLHVVGAVAAAKQGDQRPAPGHWGDPLCRPSPGPGRQEACPQPGQGGVRRGGLPGLRAARTLHWSPPTGKGLGLEKSRRPVLASLSSSAVVLPQPRRPDRLRPCAVSPEGRTFAGASPASRLRTWALQEGAMGRTCQAGPAGCRAAQAPIPLRHRGRPRCVRQPPRVLL